MKKFLVAIAGFLTLSAMAVSQPAQAAPRQIVVVVADGLNLQTVEFGNTYIKKAYDPESAPALEELQAKGNARPATDTLAALRGLLKTAAGSGFKTGFVTTGDVTKVAPQLYALPEGGDAATALVKDAQFDFIAGGGRGNFVPQGKPGSLRSDAADLAQALRQAGGTPYFDAASLEDEAKGKILVLQGDGDLSYPLDRDEENESEFSGLVTQAIDALSADNAPFILVVHDTLIAKAVAAKDTPALAEEYHQLDNVLRSLLDLREQNPADFAAVVLAGGGTAAPRFAADTDAKRSDSIFILSNLPLSYGKAGASLKGADEAAITEFATEKYQGWKISGANRAAIVAGTLDPEAAIRASYEPAVNVVYETVEPATVVYGAGIDTAAGLEAALRAIVSAKPGPATPVAEPAE